MKTSSETTYDFQGGMIHSFEPIYESKSRILILGTMASPASLRAGMYYAHPRNAFWPILSILTDEALPATNELRRALLLRHGIAVWDTLSSCKREGASDTSIRQEIPTDIPRLINCCPEIAAVFLNGSAAYGYYQKYNAGRVALPYYRLPSTSPANAAGGFEKKLEAWRVLTDYLK